MKYEMIANYRETLNKSPKQRKKWYNGKKGGEKTWDRRV